MDAFCGQFNCGHTCNLPKDHTGTCGVIYGQMPVILRDGRRVQWRGEAIGDAAAYFQALDELTPRESVSGNDDTLLLSLGIDPR